MMDAPDPPTVDPLPDHLASDQLRVERLLHRGAWQVALFFAYDPKLIAWVRSLPDRKYSQTHTCWYLPESAATYALLQKAGVRLRLPLGVSQTGGRPAQPMVTQAPPHDIETSGTTMEYASSEGDHTGISCTPQEPSVPSCDGEQTTDILLPKGERPLDIVLNGGHLVIRMPYRQEDVQMVKSLAGAWWHSGSRRWLVRATPAHVQALQGHFAFWSSEAYDRLYALVASMADPLTLELYSTPEHPDQVALKIRGYRADFMFLKTLPSRHYDRALQRWIIPRDTTLLSRIRDHYAKLGAKIVDRLPLTVEAPLRVEKLPPAEELYNRLLAKYPAAHGEILRQYIDALVRMRYSSNTLRQYTAAFAGYLTALSGQSPKGVTAEQVNGYLACLAGRKVSESRLHTAVNSIKFYYEKVVFAGGLKIEQLQRPRKSQALPTILSVREVDRLLSATDNIKHLAILYTLYSAGLRLHEVIQLRIADLHWDRHQLHVHCGKGKKDRMVMLSHTLKALLGQYFDLYQPRYWLFEGQGAAGPYSSRSIQAIVKGAAKKAGISRKVTPHTLRHCFATHLLDQGTDIRYIQELLGHKDIKTTLIYTHITTKSLEQIQSPLDRLRIQPDRNGKNAQD